MRLGSSHGIRSSHSSPGQPSTRMSSLRREGWLKKRELGKKLRKRDWLKKLKLQGLPRKRDSRERKPERMIEQ